MSDSTPLPDHVRAFLAVNCRFATLATLDPDGAPRQPAGRRGPAAASPARSSRRPELRP